VKLAFVKLEGHFVSNAVIYIFFKLVLSVQMLFIAICPIAIFDFLNSNNSKIGYMTFKITM